MPPLRIKGSFLVPVGVTHRVGRVTRASRRVEPCPLVHSADVMCVPIFDRVRVSSIAGDPSTVVHMRSPGWQEALVPHQHGERGFKGKLQLYARGRVYDSGSPAVCPFCLLM